MLPSVSAKVCNGCCTCSCNYVVFSGTPIHQSNICHESSLSNMGTMPWHVLHATSDHPRIGCLSNSHRLPQCHPPPLILAHLNPRPPLLSSGPFTGPKVRCTSFIFSSGILLFVGGLSLAPLTSHCLLLLLLPLLRQ